MRPAYRPHQATRRPSFGLRLLDVQVLPQLLREVRLVNRRRREVRDGIPLPHALEGRIVGNDPTVIQESVRVPRQEQPDVEWYCPGLRAVRLLRQLVGAIARQAVVEPRLRLEPLRLRREVEKQSACRVDRTADRA